MKRRRGVLLEWGQLFTFFAFINLQEAITGLDLSSEFLFFL